MRLLILSCSLSPESCSAVLARILAAAAGKGGDEVELLDLREIGLPFCDGDKSFGHPNVQRIQRAIASADAVVIATPIYNYDVGGSTRNMVALISKGWTEKIIGFLCAAGGPGSYMAVMGLANSLMLDFHCLIVPRFVYATGAAFDGAEVKDQEVLDRIDRLASEVRRIGTALASTPPAG